VLIYHLENVSPYAELTTVLVASAAAGRIELVGSAITVGETLVGPWRAGDSAGARRLEHALRQLPGFLVADVTFDVASRAAALRGKTGLPLPDALIMMSMIEQGAQILVTNDSAWRVKDIPARILVLEDFV
jgi:predicted nucleic acid-binding protein